MADQGTIGGVGVSVLYEITPRNQVGGVGCTVLYDIAPKGKLGGVGITVLWDVSHSNIKTIDSLGIAYAKTINGVVTRAQMKTWNGLT